MNQIQSLQQIRSSIPQQQVGLFNQQQIRSRAAGNRQQLFGNGRNMNVVEDEDELDMNY